MLKELFDPNNYFLNYYAIPVMAAGILALVLSIWVFLKNPSGTKNRRFFLFSLFIFAWLFFSSLDYFSKSENVAFFWYKYFAYNAVLFLAPIIYYFILSWENKFSKILDRLVIVFFTLMGGLAIINISTDFIIIGARPHFYGYYPILDQFGAWTILLWALQMVLGIFSIFYAFKEEKSIIVKNQIKWIVVGSCVGYSGAIDFLPAIFKSEIYAAGYIFVFLMFSAFLYAIIKYQAMEFETVVHKTFLWILSSVFLVIPVFIIIYFFFNKLMHMGPLVLSLLAFVFFYLLKWYQGKLQPVIDHIFRRRAYDYYKELHKAAETLSTDLDVDDFLKNLTDKIKNTIYAQRVLVLINSDDGYKLREGNVQKIVIPIRHGLFRAMDLYKKSIEIGDVKANPRYEDFKDETVKWMEENGVVLLVPLMLTNKIVGILALGKKSTLKPYTLNDIELLEAFGREAGIPLYNAVHHEMINEAFMKEAKNMKMI